MQVNFDQELLTLDGKALVTEQTDDNTVPPSVKKVNLTLRLAAVQALMNVVPADRNMSGDDKLKNYLLAVKVNPGGVVAITPEEAALLKTRIGLCFGPAVVGPAYQLLNG